MDARRLILWLFVALSVASALALLLFVHAMGDCDADGVPDAHDRSITCLDSTYDGTHVVLVVYSALAGDLAAPVFVWFLLAGIAAKGRERWFWYLGAAPAGLMAAAAVLILLALAGELPPTGL